MTTYLGREQPDHTVWSRLDEYQFIYVTPELLSTDRFKQVLKDEVEPRASSQSTREPLRFRVGERS